jgi:hypothetical protein
MQEEKLGQLKIIFEGEIENIIENVKNMNVYFDSETNLKEYATNKSNQLVHEVKIRINNK